MKSPLNISLIAASLLACAALSLPATAVAQATDAEAEVQAEQERPDYDPAARAADYYEQAAQAYAEGNFERAAELLHRAFAHEPNLIYKYNEILALLGSGDYQSALDILDTYREPLAADGRFDDVDELEEELLEAQAAVEAEQEAQAGEESPSEPVVVVGVGAVGVILSRIVVEAIDLVGDQKSRGKKCSAAKEGAAGAE